MEKIFPDSFQQYLFQFMDETGVTKEIKIHSRVLFKHWSLASDFPDYVKWKDQPFVILRSKINGVGLFTDKEKEFKEGEIIGVGFFKVNNSGWFAKDYKESVLATFINNSPEPNMSALLTEEGIVFKANRKIEPLNELTANYQSLIELFPRDPGVKRMIKYW